MCVHLMHPKARHVLSRKEKLAVAFFKLITTTLQPSNLQLATKQLAVALFKLITLQPLCTKHTKNNIEQLHPDDMLIVNESYMQVVSWNHFVGL